MKAWLSRSGIAFEERDLLGRPPTRAQLAAFADGSARSLVTPNTHFPEYRQHLGGGDPTDDEILDVLARVPNLLKKPMLTRGTRILQGTADPDALAAFTAGART